MTIERGDASAGGKAAKAGRFLGSLKDALRAASRDEVQQVSPDAALSVADMKVIPLAVPVMTPATPQQVYGQEVLPPSLPNLSAAEAARHAFLWNRTWTNYGLRAGLFRRSPLADTYPAVLADTPDPLAPTGWRGAAS